MPDACFPKVVVFVKRMRYAVVVMYCHSKTSVMARFFYRAQDHNMTNGDFAFFTFELWQSSSTDKLWSHYARYVDDHHDLPRRQRAFRALKQVPDFIRHL